MTLSSITETYRRALPEGELVHFSLSPFDRLGIPNQSATFFPPDGRTRGGTGYGTSDAAALVSALGETTEEYAASRGVTQMPIIEGSLAELQRERGENGVCDPRKLTLNAGSPFSPDMPRRWLEVSCWPSGEPVLVPIEYVATYGGDLGGGDYTPLVTPITNGLGAGLTKEAAIAHGLLELLQRDGNGLQIRALASPIALDQSTISDPIARDLLDKFDAEGVDVEIKVASTEWGFVNLYVAGIDREETPVSALVSAAGGEASHPVAAVALRKALLEWAAARARLAFMHGPLDAVEKFTRPGYLAQMRSDFSPHSQEKRALDAMTAWSQQSLQSARQHLQERVLRVDTRLAFSDLPDAGEALSDDKVALCHEVVRRLNEAGYEVLVADFSALAAQSGDVFAVKVIVPGLEVETLSYGRIGVRNARRLLERADVRLVARGQQPEGGRRIHLLPEDEVALGGPLWLDWPAVERLLGPLYALYREPGRHAVPFSLDS